MWKLATQFQLSRVPATSLPTCRSAALYSAMAQRTPVELPGPIETQLRLKIEQAFQPTALNIENQSRQHAHHAAMRGNTNPETHFKVTIVSAKFQGMKPLQRHRAVYALAQPELDAGLHALTLKTSTPEEDSQS
ncbi:BolA domain UV induced protein Uvi31 [Tieghemiomyces parasiticus]|uniref:BolA domain UV induced protein Uvi31 n=1 Tax=Tieghemiomyces parasiticus TaxID=78921 RepID=A0A9W7ZTB7_9FUNG|nr:BolA domain UV induced protein Uvi31 [Tieghemiomyces parasiticus]